MTFVSFLLGAGLLAAVHVTTMALTSSALGYRPSTVSLFFGPRVAGFKLGTTELQLALLPLGGFVQWKPPDEEGAPPLPPVPMILTSLSGNVVLLALGLALLVSAPLDSLWLSRAEFVALIKASPRQALAWGALAFGTLNLLPLPALNGGQMLEAVASLLRGRPVRFPPRFAVLGLLALWGGLLVWAVRSPM